MWSGAWEGRAGKLEEFSMRMCIFEDSQVARLEPLTLTRPACDLRCGASTLLERQSRYFGADEIGLVVRPRLADWCRLLHPGYSVNEPDWLQDDQLLFVNARWLPLSGRLPRVLEEQHIALVGDQVAYLVALASTCSPERLAGQIKVWREVLPQRQVGGRMIDYPWDLLTNNPEALGQDFAWFWDAAEPQDLSPGLEVVGPREGLFVHPGACVEPLVVADTRSGPVVIDRGAVVQSGSRLEGPCYVGPGSHVLGARVRHSTIGPQCRVGGEVEASILQGFSNKSHDGFLGHSYVGEWVNLGAGTQSSDLRNDYANVTVKVAGGEIDTGQIKVGAFLGDFTRTGVGVLLNCGTMTGAFSQLLPWGAYLPRTVPSFCSVWSGQLQERVNFRDLFATAATALGRRGKVWTDAHAEFFLSLYETTAPQRREALCRDTGVAEKALCPVAQSFSSTRRRDRDEED
jgi:UDP-N-acetylglucosamine diphosphorylase/glucosamine-1-phosphate N-acetyltransferase